MMKKQKCCGCEKREGQLHEIGCGQETCPFCHTQLLFCGCWEAKLKECGYPIPEENEDEWEVMLPEESENKWIEILNEMGRIPYVYYPVVCAKCGKVNPIFFHVKDKVWKKYVHPHMHNEVLCKKCFRFIVDAIDKGEKKGK